MSDNGDVVRASVLSDHFQKLSVGTDSLERGNCRIPLFSHPFVNLDDFGSFFHLHFDVEPAHSISDQAMCVLTVLRKRLDRQVV